jgi:HD-GYP domain-containing protein (c-di-GMP phosphodiesterase class II)
MLQERPYRKSFPFQTAARNPRCRETQFDPEVVDAFTGIAPRIEALIGSLRHGRFCRLDERPPDSPE